MGALLASRRSQRFKDGEWVISGVRPVTLLIGSGIILIAAILILTGLAAGHLREQALINTEGELSRLDLVLAEEANRSFAAADLAVKSVIERLQSLQTGGAAQPYGAEMAGADIHDILRYRLGAASHLRSMTVVGADGRLLNSSQQWPAPAASLADRDYFRALQPQDAPPIFIGRPVASPETGAWAIPVARRAAGPNGELLGLVVALISSADIEGFYRTVPIGEDGAIALLRRDGMLLARYPEVASDIGTVVKEDLLTDAAIDGENGTVREPGPIGGEWRIKAVRALRSYPLAVLLSRRGDRALAGWSHQALLFGAFALIGAIAIGAMVLLIARQFRIYAALATMRAEKIDMERARIAAEAELLKTERLSVLGQLTATVAHELRNPLSAIRNTLFSIKEIAAGKGLKLDRPVARMERSIERCDRIIGDLLEYTKTRELRRTELAFDAWLDEVLAEQYLPAGIALVKELHAPRAMVAIDADRIRRVIINLIDNSAQALSESQALCAEKRIAVRTNVKGRHLEVQVEDSGPGILPENLGRIFEPLFSTKSFGTGLGLATVKQIVAQHDGTIQVQSEPAHGTRVIVRLPLGEPAKAAA
ncbi:MAG: GHKL domain-containing protein [Alphaproteobacteria bacterium]|nr:GHKL domain-containing protein [Alphaproteobacteria bacterium]